MSPQQYEVDIRPLSVADGGGFIATVPELPGCFSDGETPEEALRNAYDAIGCWMEAAEEMGRPVPEPRRAAA
ncbi:type II toxin-antitoxin system HicB family antitoxin [Sphingomonas sp.]|uniref:type II toxin-antitoxin system HicB family antitoxin n=1 Tax=Sphingomonas sp. TaxID=28214 RepID=UPI003CC59BE5